MIRRGSFAGWDRPAMGRRAKLKLIIAIVSVGACALGGAAYVGVVGMPGGTGGFLAPNSRVSAKEIAAIKLANDDRAKGVIPSAAAVPIPKVTLPVAVDVKGVDPSLVPGAVDTVPVVVQQNPGQVAADSTGITFSNTDPLPPEKVVDRSVSDITAKTMQWFGFDVEYMGQSGAGSKVSGIVMRKSDCLLSWATSKVILMDGKSFTGVADVCGRQVAYIAGGKGVSGRDLLGRALDVPADAAVKALVFDKQTLDYAAVTTADGGAVLIVTSPAPS